jgi:GTP-binding protein SAR1
MASSNRSIYGKLYSYWTSLLTTLGLYQKEANLLLLGLDNAGKTTLLHRLATTQIRPFPPTDRPRQDRFRLANILFQAFDLGGHEAVRHLWQDYVPQVSAVLFLVDAADAERIEEAGYELDALVSDGVVTDLPLAILLNKCDLEEAGDTSEILRKLEYSNLQETMNDKVQVFRISVLNGEGYEQAFRWIGSLL